MNKIKSAEYSNNFLICFRSLFITIKRKVKTHQKRKKESTQIVKKMMTMKMMKKRRMMKKAVNTARLANIAKVMTMNLLKITLQVMILKLKI